MQTARRTRSVLGRGALALLAALECALAGCQQEMATQPSYRPLQASSFFADGRSSRHLVSGTVPRGQLRADAAFFTGRVAFPNMGENQANGGNQRNSGEGRLDGETDGAPREDAEAFAQPAFVVDFPLRITPELLEHGRQRYMIYCVVCHDVLGTGRGKIVERGYTAPPSYHIERLREAPVGHLFAAANEGYGSMPSYGRDVSERDLWAIVAYVRALQLSQRFPADELTDEMRREMESQDVQAASRVPRREEKEENEREKGQENENANPGEVSR